MIVEVRDGVDILRRSYFILIFIVDSNLEKFVWVNFGVFLLYEVIVIIYEIYDYVILVFLFLVNDIDSVVRYLLIIYIGMMYSIKLVFSK